MNQRATGMWAALAISKSGTLTRCFLAGDFWVKECRSYIVDFLQERHGEPEVNRGWVLPALFGSFPPKM